MSPFNDLLAEMEYTEAPSTGRVGAVSRALWEPPQPGPRRRFWRAEAQREVEVEFLGRRAVPFSALCGVRRSTAFEPAEAVTCRRDCVDAQSRHRSPAAALPGAP